MVGGSHKQNKNTKEILKTKRPTSSNGAETLWGQIRRAGFLSFTNLILLWPRRLKGLDSKPGSRGNT